MKAGPHILLCQVLISLTLDLSLSSPAMSRSPTRGAEEERVGRCIRIAARGSAWLERTLWGLRDQEGGWVGAAVRNTNGSKDLGPLQVNSWWAPRIAAMVGRPTEHVRHWLQNDPCFNVQAARWIFLTGLAATGNYWEAVGTYHSPTRWRQRSYAQSVAAHLRMRFGADAFAAAAGPAASQLAN